jgi:5'-3' exonuclease
MGIPGLFQFLKKHEIIVNTPSYVANKKVGVDLFWYLYRSKGDIDKLDSLLSIIHDSAQSCIFILDGKPTKERSTSLEGQRKKREEGYRVVESIEEFLISGEVDNQQRKYLNKYVLELKNRIWSPSPSYIQTVIKTLPQYNIQISDIEADDVLANMYKSGEIDIVISPDSDLIRLGVTSLLRPQKDSDKCIYYDISIIYPQLALTEEQWNLFITLANEFKEKNIAHVYTLVCIYKNETTIRNRYYEGLSNGRPL